MPYLTFDEYKELGFVELDETEFNRLIRKASDVLDTVTSFFYLHNDLEFDLTFRKKQFKKAVACQVEYFHDIGSASTHNINNPLTVNMGRTQIGTGVENQKQVNKITAPDVYMYLKDTGLLYRGIGVV